MAPCCFQYFTFLPKFFLFTLLLLTCTQSLLTHDNECMALYLFKQSFPRPPFEAPGFRKFDSWKITRNASNDCCLWDGVACSDEEDGGHVIGLDLSERYLRGHINSTSTLFNLAHLQTLNLAMNDFSESLIPSQISHLKRLRILNLSESGFSGQIPKEISHLIQLASLDLSFNSLKLQSPSLEKLVQNFTGLEELHLSDVEISSSVPHFLANFSSLRLIMLRNCSLQNDFPMAILQLPKLKVLNVAYNTNLTGFLPEFQNHSLLEYVNLYSTGFFGTIPKSIENLNHLTVLGLGLCSFSGIIPGSLTNMTKLTHLDLGYNEFIGVVPSLAGLTELTVLDLRYNNFSGRVELNWFTRLNKLKVLFLARNKISFVANTKNYTNDTLPELDAVDLSSCSLKEYPTFLRFQQKLSILFLNDNQIHGLIPDWGWNNSRETLETIDLSNSYHWFSSTSTFSPMG